MQTIQINGICKSYETDHYIVKAVDGVSLTLSGNEAVAVIGPSGSGKSTLINMIGLILRPDNGEIVLNGENLSKLNDGARSALRNQTFGYIVQDFALLDDENVYNNIRLPLIYSKKIKQGEHKKRILTAAESLGISDKLHRKAAKLSGGERQRVAIARAIVCDQPIILADEPTGSLDTENKKNVMDILMQLCKEDGRMLIVVTHDISVADRCDRVIQMRNGKIAGYHTREG